MTKHSKRQTFQRQHGDPITGKIVFEYYNPSDDWSRRMIVVEYRGTCGRQYTTLHNETTGDANVWADGSGVSLSLEGAMFFGDVVAKRWGYRRSFRTVEA